MTLSGTLVFFTNWVKACHIGSPDWWVCCFEIDFSGCTWHDTSAWRPQCNGLPQGSVLALVLFNLYSNDLPVTRGRKFIYADDICLAIQGQFFSELECSLSSDMARMSHFCRQWRLKPSASKTISSVFHLHNTDATHELSVYLDGQHLRHECHPTYPGVTLDCMPGVHNIRPAGRMQPAGLYLVAHQILWKTEKIS